MTSRIRRAFRLIVANSLALASPLVLPATLALSLPLTLAACSTEPSAQNGDAPPLAGARIGGPFTLKDKNERAVSWSDFAGRYRIVYFGYSFCPDACPQDLTRLMQGYAAFAKAHPALGDQVQPIFISIDPARDTPQMVGEFTAAFSPRLIGLTGTPGDIAQTAKQFGVYYARGQTTQGGYLMDHSRVAYLMGRDGQPMAILPVDQGPQAVAAELAKWVS